jgi:predicted aminopeptidase
MALLMLQGCGYLLKSAWEEAKILARRERIERIIEREKLDASSREKLALVLEAREFAKNRGLNVGGAYSQYARVDSSSLVWVVTAAPELELKPKTWWFPIVGRVPYKGFFSKEEAIDFSKKLPEHDVSIRSSSAFSTLGYFNDPVLSTMLEGDEVQLVDTLFHELLHRTIWIPGGVDFNESLANFVGITLAEEFFAATGREELLQKASARKEEEFNFSDFIGALNKDLTELYASQISRDEKLSLKSKILERARSSWGERNPQHHQLEKYPLNNASLIALGIYLRELRLFESLYGRCGRDSARFIRALEKTGHKGEPFDEIRNSDQKGGICG